MRTVTHLILALLAAAFFPACIAFGQEPQPGDTPPIDATFDWPPQASLRQAAPLDAMLPATAEPAAANDLESPEKAPSKPLGLEKGWPGMGGPGMGGPGMGGPGMGGPGMGGPGYAATWYPSTRMSGSSPGTDFGLLRQNISAGMPVWGNGADLVMLNVGVRNSMFFTDVVLPESHRPFPDDLWNVNLGTMAMHKFANGWSGMLGVNFGSASDKPFHSIHEMTVGVMSSLQVPAKNGRDLWMFMLMYSPVGNLNFPIPMVAYRWNPSETFQASLGLPFSVLWRPAENWTIQASYMPLVTVNARATCKLAETAFAFVGFESLQDAYLLADREDVKDRFMGFEKRVIAGLRWDAWQHAALEFSAGYAFDRYYGSGQNQIGGSLHDQVDVAPGAFLSTSFQVRF